MEIGRFYLDGWEQSFPDCLRCKPSGVPDATKSSKFDILTSFCQGISLELLICMLTAKPQAMGCALLKACLARLKRCLNSIISLAVKKKKKKTALKPNVLLVFPFLVFFTILNFMSYLFLRSEVLSGGLGYFKYGPTAKIGKYIIGG